MTAPPPVEQILVVRYSLESSPGPVDNYRSKRSITGSIVLLDNTDKRETEIGRLHIDPLLFDTGGNNGWNYFEIFDTGQYLMGLSSVIWNFEESGFVKPLNKFFEYGLIESDMLYMHTIEILPEYRGADRRTRDERHGRQR